MTQGFEVLHCDSALYRKVAAARRQQLMHQFHCACLPSSFDDVINKHVRPGYAPVATRKPGSSTWHLCKRVNLNLNLGSTSTSGQPHESGGTALSWARGHSNTACGTSQAVGPQQLNRDSILNVHLEGNRNALSVRMMARQHSERNRISLPRTLMVARCLPIRE